MYCPDCRDKANAERSKFCTRKCKDAYHRNGGMNIDRLQEVMSRRIVKQLRADEEFLEAVCDKLRASSLGLMVRELAREEAQVKVDAALERFTTITMLQVIPKLLDRYLPAPQKVDLDLETELERVAKLPGKPS
jgi:hypothetical protein